MQNYAKLHGGMGIYDDLMMIYGATLSLSLHRPFSMSSFMGLLLLTVFWVVCF